MNNLQNLQYYTHMLLNSKYKFILYLLFYILILLIYNNHTNYAYCIESEENTTTNKYLGMGLFLGSIALMLFIQKYTGGVDPSALIDVASNVCESTQTEQLVTSPIEQDPKEYLDFFNITNTGSLEITGVPIDTNNVYLNADNAIHQMQNNISDRMNMLIEPIRQFHFRQESPQVDVFLDSQAFIDAHVAFLKEMDNLIAKQTLLLYQNSQFLSSVVSAGKLNPTYLELYNHYLQDGRDPANFINVLRR